MQCRSRAGPSLFSKKTASLRYQFYVQPGRYRACTVCLTFCSMDPATALPPAPPQRKATSSAESESSSAHEEDDLSLVSDWTNEDERASQGDGQPRVNDKSPTIDKDVQDSLLAVSTSATDVETLRITSVQRSSPDFIPSVRQNRFSFRGRSTCSLQPYLAIVG